MKPGDAVQIDARYSGSIVASMDTNEYLPGFEVWALFKTGVMIDADFGGMVHCTEGASDELVLVHRDAV